MCTVIKLIGNLRKVHHVLKLNSDQGNRAWTLTSVYGTGKSGFAHYLISLCANSQNKMQIKALSIAEEKLGKDKTVHES